MDVVNLRAIKEAVTRLLPVGHPFREAVLGEPDELPRTEAAIKMAAYYSLARALQRSRP